MTPMQTNLLAIIKHQFGTKKARGFIPGWAIGSYDMRAFTGLLRREAIILEQRGWDDLPQYRLAPQHRRD